MVKFKAHRPGLRRPGGTRRGTTLVEILVVIVIFLIGILAVVQIFPKGFGILTLTRKAAQATALARGTSEQLQAHADELPDQILAVTGNGVDPNVAPTDLGPAGATLDGNGILYNADGKAMGDWAFFTAANRFRRVVGETHRLPAPRPVGATAAYYGGALLPTFGPIDPSYGMTVSGNDLNRNLSLPTDLQQDPQSSDLFDTIETYAGSDFFVDNSTPTAPLIYLPTGGEANGRIFQISVYATVGSGGAYRQRYFRNVPISVAQASATTVQGQAVYPYVRVDLASQLASSGQLLTGETLAAINLDSLRIARGYRDVTKIGFSPVKNGDVADPFEYKVLNPALGLLLFNPLAYNTTFSTSAGREPLVATLDYTVYDWRNLRDDFRLEDGPNPEHRLPIGNLKIGGNTGPDGLTLGGIDLVEPRPANNSGLLDVSTSQSPRADNLAIVDMLTGGIVCERNPNNSADGTQYVIVDKSAGLIRFADADNNPSNGVQGYVLLPDGTVTTVTLTGRALRAIYRANNEWEVQVLKAATNYVPSLVLPTSGQYYVGASNSSVGGVATRIYFPPADANQKVTIGTVTYVDGGRQRQQIFGQDYVIRFRAGDPIGLPSVDVTEAAPGAASFDFSTVPVQDVKGASLIVRTLWNPETFRLTNNSATNMNLLNVWGRGWRRSTVQTYLEGGQANP